ncbi:radical SAM/SPASM domain-containing protein [Methanobacterium spitsbergense]|uniref:Radical SAM protein n=1 Tax=Methanobacterium spitsbergense TaxID=2874285 RepID=A0A8T5UUD0_9EURY|nr:radical SAM protein [Methanobacterium spitsbergense]MBZ2164473.1 radical SAM protein [Methanobacterium spitsbergense]
MIRKHYDGYNFVGIPETGITFRWGKNFKENPYMAPWPELADISISNYCTNECEYCYRSSNPEGKLISIKNYEFILEQLTSNKYGAVFQVALGGGEPLLHPDFNEILEITKEKFNIIPNYTTSGKFFDEKNIESTKKYCGAIAISYDPYRDLSLDELYKIGSNLFENDIKANIHYVISEKTLDNAIEIIEGKYDKYFEMFNAIIFLTHKPFGRADNQDSIKSPDKLNSFLNLIDNPISKVRIGFDACFVPILMKNTDVDNNMIDSCECGFFSVYIDENLNVMPCSFCNNDKYKYNLKEFNFEDIWQNKFLDYRNSITEYGRTDCGDCDKLSECRGKCPFFDELFLCEILF